MPSAVKALGFAVLRLPEGKLLNLSQIATDILDRILAWQMIVAWAGETPDGASRLNWWRTDLIDRGAGGYLLAEMMPRTHRWASLEAALRAAIQADQQKRLDMANPDAVRTLFFWGFGIDEQLSDRLREHKLHQSSPDKVLALAMNMSEEFSREELEAALQLDSAPKYKVVPSGRQMMEPMPGGHDLCAAKLAAALLPLTDEYSMPFYFLEG